jgi:hypothetical protein
MEATTEASTPSTNSRTQSLSGENDSDLVLVVDEKATPIDPSQHASTVRPIHGYRWVLAMVAVYVTAFLYGLDTTIAADVQPAIVQSLGGIEKLTWIGVGFPLGSVASILPIGYSYGLFEIKWLYFMSVVVFEAGSALCGGAPNMNALIVGRVIAGKLLGTSTRSTTFH